MHGGLPKVEQRSALTPSNHAPWRFSHGLRHRPTGDPDEREDFFRGGTFTSTHSRATLLAWPNRFLPRSRRWRRETPRKSLSTLAPTFLALVGAVVVVSISRLTFPRVTKVPVIVSAPAPVRMASRPVAFEIENRIGTFRLALEHQSTATHLGVLGTSGSGKLALIRCLTGAYGPSTGPVWYGDQLVQAVAVEGRRGRSRWKVAVLPASLSDSPSIPT